VASDCGCQALARKAGSPGKMVATMSRWASSWALISAVAAMALGCHRSAPAAGPIVLIVVDTLRADHLSCYGYGRPTSAAMCALAADGVRFDRAYTTRTSTTPAIASMLTGLYPHRHGVKDVLLLLPTAITTVTKRIQAAGWATGGFVSSFVMVRDFNGFEAGFDVYDDDVRTRELVRENYQRDAPETVLRAATWLRRHGPRAFLFVHLIEPHGPYTPPAPYLERFALPATGPEPGDIPAYQRLPGVRTVSEYVGRYDGEIAAADAALAELFEHLRGLGWYDQATIVLVADHGESLGEENLWFRHGTGVHDAEARVPLIVKFPAGRGPTPGTVIHTPVSVIDVYPTLLSAAGVAENSGPRAAVDLARVAAGEMRTEPPVTEFEEGDAVTLAIHGDRCTGRWQLPLNAVDDPAFAAAGGGSWSAAARQLRIDPPGTDGQCSQAAAAEAGALIVDRLRFRLEVPVIARNDMRDALNRTRFIDARIRSGPTVDAHEHEALRQLGYAE